MQELDLEKIAAISKELKEANKLLDEFFRKQALMNREKKLQNFTSSEKSAYWAGLLDARNESAH